MEYEQLKAMLESHCCTQCEAPLSLIWDGKTSEYALVCGTDRSHQGYKSLGSASQAIARGQGDKLLGKGGQTDMEKQLARATHPMSMLPLKDLGSNNDLTGAQVASLVQWAESLGLKAYLGHVCLYYGKPYRTIDGLYYTLATRKTPVAVGTRPLSEAERASYMISEGAYAWLAEGWLDTTKIPTTGLGIVTREETEAKSEKKPEHFRAPIAHDHPQRMAEKRAEWQLLRKLVPLEEKEGD
jgi:hypothetical protein